MPICVLGALRGLSQEKARSLQTGPQTTLHHTQQAGNRDGYPPAFLTPLSVLSSYGTLERRHPRRTCDSGSRGALLPWRSPQPRPAPTSWGGAEECAARGGAIVPGRELHAVAEGYPASGDGPAGSLAAAATPRHVSYVPPTTLQQPRGTSAQPFSSPARPFRLGSTPPET